MRRWLLILLTLGLLALAGAVPAVALADLSAPWNGQPVSPGLGPTYGEPWPVTPPADEAVSALQGAPLALIPYADILPVLEQFKADAASAGVAPRMTYWVTGKSAAGRDMYAVVVNDLETANQKRDYERWRTLRNMELTNPAQAQTLLANWRGNVKMPIYIEAAINGTEYEGTDAVMQAIRDLTTTPYGQNPTVDKLLDHAVLIFVPTQNPDGRVMGIRGNSAVADTNRDYFIQSQPEERNSAAVQQQYLETAGLDMHGYYNPMLIEGLTPPHNPGLQYDIFAHWNQLRIGANRTDLGAIGIQIQSPVNDWGSNGAIPTRYAIASATESGNTVTITTSVSAGQITAGTTVTISGVAGAGYNGTFPVAAKVDNTHFTYTNTVTGLGNSSGGTAGLATGPAYSLQWDDWPPIYGQSYEAFMGVDASTVEMPTQPNGRLTSKTAQYLAFYSSANFWVDQRQAMMHDQLEVFRRGVENAPTDPNAIDSDPLLVSLGFSDALHNWMVTYPEAYIIPFGAGQRSDAEANRLVEWLRRNGIQVDYAKKDFTWNGTSYQAGSYVVSMNQALRGLAWNALAAGTDPGIRITRLYSPPGAWSHGLLWGADTVEVPRNDTSFAPLTKRVMMPNSLVGGIRGGVGAPADFYSVALKGVHQDQALLDVLRSGVKGELAEAPFASTTGGQMPAGTLIFPADSATARKLDAAGKAAGMWIERNVDVPKPATTKVNESPKIAILTTNGTPTKTIGPTTYVQGADTDGVLKILFGADAQYVGTTGGPNPLSNPAIADPLAGFDVIYNAGAAWPSNLTAQGRLNDFFARGGGYIATSVSTSGFSFLSQSGLVSGTLTQSQQSAAGGIAIWANVGGAASPVSGAYPGQDFMFLLQNLTYFTTLPSGATVDGQYLPNFATVGPAYGWVAGLWNNRDAAANNAPVLIRGNTSAGGRYTAYANNPFTRYDFERAWPLFVQAALWSDLTDE